MLNQKTELNKMQTTGYIIDKRNNEKILVLAREGKKLDKYCHKINLKLRLSGKNGTHFIEEENYLNENRLLLNDLLLGKTISI